ncbi:MAG: hypothetical protein IJY65_00995 [Clostridia bacterium]|nr:hypothetical protein [Clostridia bacterium]
MSKRIICLLLAITMLLGSMLVLASCGGGGDNGDDNGGNENGGGGGGNVDTPGGGNAGEEYDWDTTSLYFQMVHDNNAAQELAPGCKRYMAGEDDTAVTDLDNDIRARNIVAEQKTKVDVDYAYWPNTGGYGWGSNVDRITEQTKSGDADAPDFYCNMIYDMVACSLLGAFANLKATEARGTNYFTFVGREFNGEDTGEGYMYEYMTSLTLSKFKMYILASDYFIDLVRAFLTIPVNISMLNTVLQQVEGDAADYNGDGVYDVNDFYEMVKQNKWTYTKMAAYCSAIYKSDGTGAAKSIHDDRVGFAIGSASGLPATGLVYTSSVVVIHRDWDYDKNDYNYYYPETNTELGDLADALYTLFNSEGVITVSEADAAKYGENATQAIRVRFSGNHVLFGNIICVGSLESSEYQTMKDASSVDDPSKGYGFGVVPVPLYRDNSDDRYLTQIHNVGRCGAISAATTKFSQCSAFLNYLSLNSTDILNSYYDNQLQYAIADGSPGNVYMLQYIRYNVRTSFDKAFEDAMGVFYQTSNENAFRERWHTILQDAGFMMTNMAERYEELYPVKKDQLDNLVKQYEDFKD